MSKQFLSLLGVLTITSLVVAPSAAQAPRASAKTSTAADSWKPPRTP